MSSLFEPIDIYCERLEPGLWAEPLNAISNLSFIIAAVLLFKLCKKQGIKDIAILGLSALIFIIGIGSTLFHTFANKWSMLADVIPIAAFVFIYLWFALRRMVGLGYMRSLAFMGLFFIAAAEMDRLPIEHSFNGSVAYFPCLLAVLLIGFTLYLKRKQPQATFLLAAGIIFAISLSFRSIDMMLCPSLALGTHYFWHLFNGAVLYLLVKALIAEQKQD